MAKYFDHKNEFGISPMASNKIDHIDSPEPPVFDKYISFYSSAKNSYGYDKKITTDFRNRDDSLKVWSLVLETNIEEESAQIDIDGTVDQVLLETLSPRERQVIEYRFGINDSRPRTLEEVGQTFGVTRERIRQIEAKALRKLRHPTRSLTLRDYLDF